ncbi:hypothetical protein E4U32_003395 [Claviceps aff. humidiphila group G2b]|nr:hypothetical protein E4U32_003395 [Claviceps aff. humidiphila group G2b]
MDFWQLNFEEWLIFIEMQARIMELTPRLTGQIPHSPETVKYHAVMTSDDGIDQVRLQFRGVLLRKHDLALIHNDKFEYTHNGTVARYDQYLKSSQLKAIRRVPEIVKIIEPKCQRLQWAT